ncbi:MAG: hypothetical protein Q7T03_07950 [Deltaproteobacteria bacterium]|nr:hypothetical protein [Deltaproteobacteria bacterium]
MKKIIIIFFMSMLFLSGTGLRAQTRDKEIQFYTGAGAGLRTPVRFDFDMAGEYFLNDRWSIGLDLDVFVRGKTSFDAIPFGRYHFDLPKWPRFLPYIGGGMGALANSSNVWLDVMLPEGGFLYELNPHLYIGPNVSFHILGGPSTTWDLQMLGQLAYRF